MGAKTFDHTGYGGVRGTQQEAILGFTIPLCPCLQRPLFDMQLWLPWMRAEAWEEMGVPGALTYSVLALV